MEFLNQVFPENELFIRSLIQLRQAKERQIKKTQVKKITQIKRIPIQNPFQHQKIDKRTKNQPNHKQNIKLNQQIQRNNFNNKRRGPIIEEIIEKPPQQQIIREIEKKENNKEIIFSSIPDESNIEPPVSVSSNENAEKELLQREDLLLKKLFLIVKKGKNSELISFFKNYGSRVNINERMPLGNSIYSPIQEKGGPFDGWGAIHIAAWRGDLSILQTLIANGIDISLFAHQNEQAISIATWKGHIEIVNELLEHGANIHSMNKNRNNQEPIHICAIKNRAEIFQLILSRSYQPTSALVPLLFEVMQIIITLKEVNFELVEEATKFAFSKNEVRFFESPNFSSFISKLIDLDFKSEARMLLKHLPKKSSDLDPIKSCIKKGSDYHDLLEKLIPTYFSNNQFQNIIPPLELCIQKDDLEVFKMLFPFIGTKNLDYYYLTGSFLFYYACNYNAINIIKYIVEIKAVKDASLRTNGESIYHLVVRKNYSELIDYLMDNFDFDIFSATNLGENTLHLAARIQYDDLRYNFLTKIIKKGFLNEKNIKQLNNVNKIGMTPLHVAACSFNYDFIDQLLKFTSEKNEKEYVNVVNHSTKFSALHYVVNNTNEKNIESSYTLIELLLKYGANISLKCITSSGDSTSITQLASNFPNLMNFLIKNGAEYFEQIFNAQKVQKSWKLLTFDDYVPSEFEDLESGKVDHNNNNSSYYSNIAAASPKFNLPKIIRNRWKEIRLFISSTFIDMFNERELLIKKVIPRVKDFCYSHQIHLTEIDLRWGVTEEQVQSGKAIQFCLSEARDSDIFCGIIGHRYGWVPEISSISQDVLDEFNWKEGNSITQMEIENGVFYKQSSLKKFSALFFIRSNQFMSSVPSKFKNYFEENDKLKSEKVQSLRRSINDKKSPNQYSVIEYTPICSSQLVKLDLSDHSSEISYPSLSKLEELEEKFEEEVKKLITNRWINDNNNNNNNNNQNNSNNSHHNHHNNNSKELNNKNIIAAAEDDEIKELNYKMEEEKNNHLDFIEFRSRSFIGRQQLIEKVISTIVNDGYDDQLPISIFGNPGSGKSSLVSKLVHSFQSELLNMYHENGDKKYDPDEYFLIYHFVGATTQSTSIYHTIHRICFELMNNILFLNQPIETEYDKLITQFNQLLEKVSINSSKKVLIVIDAINQFDHQNSSHSLDWLPLILPKKVCLVVSCLPGDCLDVLKARKLNNYINIDPLSRTDQEMIITSYLQQYSKKLTDQQIEMIINKSNIVNPLYLTIISEELRIFGQFELINQKILSFPANVTLLIEQVLIRLENEFNPSLISKILGLIECSRFGLLEHEIIEILQLPRYQWTDILLSLKFFLRPLNNQKNNERILDYFHRQIAKAIHLRYFTNNQNYLEEIHSLLADYFLEKIQHNNQLNNQNNINNKKDNKKNNSGNEINENYAGYSRGFSEVIFHLLNSSKKRVEEAAQLLTSLNFIEKKCSSGFTFELIDDYLLFSSIIQSNPNLPLDDETKILIEEFKSWSISNSHILLKFPHLIYQTIINDPLNKNIAKSAEKQLRQNKRGQFPIMRWLNKPNIKSNQIQSLNIGSEVNVSIATSDNRFLIIGTKGGSAKVFDSLTGQEKMTLIKQSQRITSISISEDDLILLITFATNIAIFNLQTFTLISQLTISDCEVLSSAVALKKNSNNNSKEYFILTGDLEGIIQIYQFKLDTGEAKLNFQFFDQKKILYLKFSKGIIKGEENGFISCSSDKSARFYSISGKLLLTLVGHTKTIKSADFVPSKNWIITSSQDYSMKIWNDKTGELITTINGHSDNVQSITISDDQKFIITGSWDKTVRAWSIDQIADQISQNSTNDFPNFIIGNHSHFINFVHFISPNLILSGSVDMTAKIFKLPVDIIDQLNNSVARALHHRSLVVGLDYNFDRDLILTGSWDRTAKLFDRKGNEMKEFLFHTKRVNNSLFTKDSKNVITSSMDGTNMVFNLDTNDHQILSGQNSNILSGAISHDDRYYASGSSDGNIFFWDLKNMKMIEKINKAHSQWVVSLEFSPFSRLLVSGCTDGSIYVWNTSDGSRLFSMVGHTKPVLSLKFHSSGKFIASGAEDKLIKIWSTKNYECLMTISGHSHEVSMVEFGEDDPYLFAIFQTKNLLITSSSDKTIRFWDFITGKLLWIYYGCDAFMSVKYCGKGLFAAGDSLGGLHLINLTLEK